MRKCTLKFGCVVEEATMLEDTAEQKHLEKEVWKCLDSVHHLLKRREVLHHTLRKGWMELTSARYAMGPARISSPLFSLKPHAHSAIVNVRGSPTDLTGQDDFSELDKECDQALDTIPVAFDLVRHNVEKERKGSMSKVGESSIGDKKPPAQLRRRLTSTTPSEIDRIADDEKRDGWEIRSLTDDSATESDDELTVAEAPKDTTQPLYWFGALVSPHLRSSQSSFSQALDLIVELVNAQNEATHAHSNVLRLRRAVSVVDK